MKSHYTIPFFIPHKGCPFSCIFCDQNKITGKTGIIPPSGVAPKIRSYLKTIPKRDVFVETAFFGGSFTGLKRDLQRSYLEKVRPFIKKGQIQGIRISTRPDFIDADILAMLKKFGVERIELGVQSISDKVLKRSGRGHTAYDVERASRLILEKGFRLGHQLMVGLPGSTFKDELLSAKRSIMLGAGEVRIYPLVVIKGTPLAKMWSKGLYIPLSEGEAIKRCAALISLFEKEKVRVIRCGLHPSKGLLSGKEYCAGPFHPAFRQKVETYLYRMLFKAIFKDKKLLRTIKTIFYNPKEASSVIGYCRANAVYIEGLVDRRGIFKASASTKPGTVCLRFNNGKRMTAKRSKY
ncbi:MAG: radical SAM protein [Candidatus Omnitrophota bacterium]